MTDAPAGARPVVAGLLAALGLCWLGGVRPATAATLPVPTTTVTVTLPGVEPVRVGVPRVDVVPGVDLASPTTLLPVPGAVAPSAATDAGSAPPTAEPPVPPTAEPAVRSEPAVGSEPSGTRPAPPAEAPPSLTARHLREAAAESARAFGFPFGLALLVALFLAVQHRIDARDPRLVAAPVDDDLRSFG